ncbi:Sphingomyelin phosphodiesterase [Entamoeba marina]
MLLFLIFFSVVSAVKIWIATDTHFDDEYVEGSYASCLAVDCCHQNSRPRKNHEDELSGRCGSYNCYAPFSTVVSGFDFISSQQDGNILFWLMDVVPGDVVTQSKTTNKRRIEQMTTAIKEKLPGYRVFPVPGNHDYYLSSEWKYPPDSQWMLDFLAEQWSGYYTEQLLPGLRLISLNLAFVDIFNIHYTLYPEKDPGGLMQWLNVTLMYARNAGEKVVFISHECIGLKEAGTIDLNAQFNEDFTIMMEEYNDIVLTHFCGHSHYDSFRVLPSLDNPIFNTIANPAQTTYGGLNPRIKLVEMDMEGVVDWTTYVLDIEQCNLQKDLYNWTFYYNAHEQYGLERYDTQSLAEFAKALKDDDQLWNTFMTYYKDEDHKSCTGTCKTGILCALSNLRESDYQECIKQ